MLVWGSRQHGLQDLRTLGLSMTIHANGFQACSLLYMGILEKKMETTIF